MSDQHCTEKIKHGVIVDWVSRAQRVPWPPLQQKKNGMQCNALYEGVRHGEFHSQFLRGELGFKSSDKVHWYCDSIATVRAAMLSQKHTGRTCYLDVKLKRTRELMLQGSICSGANFTVTAPTFTCN